MAIEWKYLMKKGEMLYIIFVMKEIQIYYYKQIVKQISNNKMKTSLHLKSKKGYFYISENLIEDNGLLNVYDFEKIHLYIMSVKTSEFKECL